MGDTKIDRSGENESGKKECRDRERGKKLGKRGRGGSRKSLREGKWREKGKEGD